MVYVEEVGEACNVEENEETRKNNGELKSQCSRCAINQKGAGS